MNIGELFVKIGIKGGKESIATMSQLKNTTVAAKAAVLGLVVAFAKMSQEARKFAMNMEVFEANTGLSGQTLQKMSWQAAQAGVSLENMAGTLQTIQSMSKQIALGEGNIKPFQMLGIDSQQDPVKILNDIGNAIRRNQKDPAMIRQIVDDFGISNELYYALLQKQTEELDKQFLLKDEDKEALVKLNQEWYKIWWYVKQIGIKSQGFLAHVALPLVKAVGSVVKFVGELIIGYAEIARESKEFQKSMMIVALALAAVAAALFPVTASLIGIALICEDIYGYFTGKDSILGRMIEWIRSGQILKDIFMTIGEIIRSISTALFGRKFTKKAADFLMNRDQNGVSKGIPNPFGISGNIFDFAKPSLAGVPGGFNITQYNNANFLSRGAKEDAETAGSFVKDAAVDNAAMQESDLNQG